MMVYTMGLAVGTVFINVIHKIKVSQKLIKTEKELAINVAVLTRDVFTLLSSLISLYLSLTVFVKYTADQD